MIIASSTCVRQEAFPSRKPNAARDLMDVQAVIVPGVGVAACQAGADNTRENQMLVYNELKKGTPPADILEMLKKDPNIERRQFGIVAIPNGKTITAAEQSRRLQRHRQLAVVAVLRRPGRRLLLPGAGQHAARRSGRLPGGARLHARHRHDGRSRDGGDGSGGCEWRRSPLQLRQQPARLRAVRQQDRRTSPTSRSPTRTIRSASTHNDGKYFAYIAVGDNDIKKGESANPVKTLRMRYDAWVKAGAKRTAPPGPTLYKP